MFGCKILIDLYGFYSVVEKKIFLFLFFQLYVVFVLFFYIVFVVGVVIIGIVGKKVFFFLLFMKFKVSYNNVKYVIVIFDYEVQVEGDLFFCVGDRIEIVEQIESVEDWWIGRLNGVMGVFFGNYIQVE